MAKKSITEVGKSLKRPKMQIHEKKFWLIWFHEFFLFIFSGHIIAYSESKRVTPISNKQFTKEFLILLHVTSLDSKSRLFRLFLHHRQISLGFSHLYIRFRSER